MPARRLDQPPATHQRPYRTHSVPFSHAPAAAPRSRLLNDRPRANSTQPGLRLTSRGVFPRWPFAVPVPRLNWMVIVAWVLALLIMVRRERPRLANRWGWFWVFTIAR